jgi:DNA-binding SARP family transcriptional activator
MKARRIPDELVGSSASGSGDLAAEPQVRLNLLPTFQLEIDGEGARLQAGAQRLLAYLALQDGAVLRASVAGVLWLDSTEEHAHASLRSAIWRLGRCGVPLIVADRDTLGLGDQLEVDFRQVVRLAKQLIAGPGECEVATLDPKVLSVDLLVGWYDDWVVFEQERLRQLRIHALEALARQLVAEGRFGRAIDAAFAAVQAEPLRETAHRTLIETFVAEGNPAEAIQQYRRFAALLGRSVGIAPSEPLQRLVAEMTADTPVSRRHG